MIRSELRMVAASLAFGAGIIISYGFAEVLRRFFHLRKAAKIITELIYWSGAAVFAFWLQFRLNDGILRFYSVLAAMAGLVVAHMLTGKLFAYLIVRAQKAAVKRKIRCRKRRLAVQNRLKKHWKQVKIKLESIRKQCEKEEKES